MLGRGHRPQRGPGAVAAQTHQAGMLLAERFIQGLGSLGFRRTGVSIGVSGFGGLRFWGFKVFDSKRAEALEDVLSSSET